MILDVGHKYKGGSMKIKRGESILFIGDSITDCGRRTTERPLGNGYVKLFADLLIIRESGREITIINKGIGGDIVTGLRNRWNDDVLRNKPDWISIKIGINDLHKTLRQAPDAVPPELYREAYEEILSCTKSTLPKCKFILIDPFYLSKETSSNSFRSEVLKLMPEYLKIVNELSEKYQALHLKTHEIFQRQLRFQEPDTFCLEPVHPNLTGHLLIAESLYDVLTSSK